ncbi:hypothetical protein GX586_10995, partial [bacterium]|nr:hypothetical protein [bacterium]
MKRSHAVVRPFLHPCASVCAAALLAVVPSLMSHAAYVPTGSVWSATGGGYLQAGLCGEYYPNTSFSGAPSFTRQDVRINFDWGTLLPVGGSRTPAFASFPRDSFSIRWTGQIMARFSEPYTFRAFADDSFVVEYKETNDVSWTPLISIESPATTGISAAVALDAGVPYDIRISYVEETGTAFAKLLWSSPSTPEEVIEPITAHGLNAASWGANYCFADLVKRARWNYELPKTDSNGWLTVNGQMVLADGVDNLNGTYLMEFKGRATVVSSVGGASFLVGTNWITTLTNGLCYDAQSNTTRTQVKTSVVDSGWFFSFTATQRDNESPTNTGITDIRFMRPLVPGTNVPHELGTVVYEPVRRAFRHYSVLRWLQVANLDPVYNEWQHRTRPAQMRFFETTGCKPSNTFVNCGECWEYLIMLANECGKDLYITAPIQANNEYFLKLAQLFKYGSDGSEPYTTYQVDPLYPPLNPNLAVHIELGNEIWQDRDDLFPSSGYALRQGILEVASNTVDGAILNYDGLFCSNAFRMKRRFLVLRSVRCSDAFRGVFGDEGMGSRVRMLLEQQYTNPNGDSYYAYRFLDSYFNNADGLHVTNPHPVRYYLWGGGGATYYGMGDPSGNQTNIVFSDPEFASPVVPDGSTTPGTQGGAWTFTNDAGIYRNGSLGVTFSTTNGGGQATPYAYKAIGMRIRTGSTPLRVRKLGRWYAAGQGGLHTCQVVRVSDKCLLAEAHTGGIGVQDRSIFRYGDVKAPETNLSVALVLETNTEYYIVSQEIPSDYCRTNTRVGPCEWFTVDGAVSAIVNGTTTNPTLWTFTDVPGENLCHGPVGLWCSTNLALPTTRFNKVWPAFDEQAAFIVSNGAVSTSVNFTSTGLFALTFSAAGDGAGTYPGFCVFDILVDGVCMTPYMQLDDRVKAASTRSIGYGYGRSMVDFSEIYGSCVFNITNTGLHTVTFIGRSSTTNNFTLFDAMKIASFDQIMDSGFGAGGAIGQIAEANYANQLNTQAAYAKVFGLETVAYEAGQSIGGDFLARPIHRHVYFHDARTRYLNNTAMDIFTGSGGHLNVWGVYAYWPVYDIVGADNYPLMQSLADLSSRLRAEGSNGIPTPASLGTNAIINWAWTYGTVDSSRNLTNRGAWATWLITCGVASNYTVQVNATSGGVLRLEVDGVALLEGETHVVSGTCAKVFLCKGVHGVRVRNEGGRFSLASVGGVVVSPATRAAAPVLTPAPGFLPITNVSISTETEGATIRYTTDGSVPTDEHGELYTGALALSNNMVLSAVAFRDDMDSSSVVSGSYYIMMCMTSTNAVTVPEEDDATFQVWLSTAPGGAVTVSVSRLSGDTNIAVSSGATLVFNAGNWSTPQTVTLSAADDLDIRDGSAAILCAAPGVSGAIVTATEDDDDTLGISTSTETIVVPEGGTNSFLVYITDVISSSATVTVSRADGDADIAVKSGATLVFTPADWSTPQRVTLKAAMDADADDGVATIRCSTPGLADTDVAAVEDDGDVLVIETSDDAVTVPEGGTMAFAVRLSAAPLAASTVSVGRAFGDEDIAVSAGATLVFTPENHAAWQIVTLDAGADADATDGTATIRCACDGLSDTNVTATEDDAETLAVLAAPGAVTVPEGGNATFQLSLAAAPGGPATVSVARTAGDTDITVADGASLVFTPGDWNVPRTVTLAAAADADAIDGSATFTCSAQGAVLCDVTARERDFEMHSVCYDGFDVSQRALHGALSGTGWTNNTWQVQGAPTNGFLVVNGSLLYGDLVTKGNKAEGGLDYKTSGRSLDLGSSFAPWVTNLGGVNYIGRMGTELWMSYVTRLPVATYEGKVSFDDTTPTYLDNFGRCRVKQLGGRWYLSAINESYASTSSVSVAANTNYLMVLHFVFAATNTAELFINPPLTGAPPATPSAVVKPATNAFRFIEVNWLPGNTTVDGWLDEIRFGSTFAAVTPTIATVVTNTDDIAVNGDWRNDERSGYTIIFTGTIGGTGAFVTANGMTNVLIGTIAPGFGAGMLTIYQADGVVRLGAPDDALTLEIEDGDLLVLSNCTDAVSLGDAMVSFLNTSTEGATNWFLYSTSGIQGSFAGVTFAQGSQGQVIYDPANNRAGVCISTVQPRVVVSTNALAIAEGRTARLYVRLRVAPAAVATVTVARISGDTDLSVAGGGTLYFTPANWSIDQPVTLQAAEDADASDGVAVFRCASAGSSDVDVAVTESDNDAMALVVSDTEVIVPEGGTELFDVQLTAAPEGAATVGVSRVDGDADISVQNGATRVFTAENWNTPQQVTLHAAEDADMTESSASIRCSSAGMTDVDVTATEDENDSYSGTVAIRVSRPIVTVPESGEATFKVWFSEAVATDVLVTVARTAGDADITVSSGASLTFTPDDWDEPQTVTLAAAEDADAIDGSATITCSAQDASPCGVTAWEKDAQAHAVCYDGFDITQRLFYGICTGTGWSNYPWLVEGAATNVGYLVVNGSLEHGNLVTKGNRAEGGFIFRPSGRYVDRISTFAPWATNIGGVNYVGRNGTELWISYVTRLASTSFHGKVAFDDGASVFHDNNGRCRVKQVNGRWYLSAMNDAYASTSSVSVAANTNYLMVLHFIFGDTDTVELFINPALTGAPPATPAATVSMNLADELFRFTEIVWHPGDTPADGWIDELRFGATFAAVTPTIAAVFTNTDDIAVNGDWSNDERSGYTIVFTSTITGTGLFVTANGMTNILVGTLAPGFGPGALTIDSADGVVLLGMPGDALALEIENGDLLVLSNFAESVLLGNTTVRFLSTSTEGTTNWFLYSTSGIEGEFAGVTFAPGSQGAVIYDY